MITVRCYKITRMTNNPQYWRFQILISFPTRVAKIDPKVVRRGARGAGREARDARGETRDAAPAKSANLYLHFKRERTNVDSIATSNWI